MYYFKKIDSCCTVEIELINIKNCKRYWTVWDIEYQEVERYLEGYFFELVEVNEDVVYNVVERGIKKWVEEFISETPVVNMNISIFSNWGEHPCYETSFIEEDEDFEFEEGAVFLDEFKWGEVLEVTSSIDEYEIAKCVQ